MMRRTTVAIEDQLLNNLKLKAAREGKSLGAIMNELLHRALTLETGHTTAMNISWKTYSCGSALVDITDRDALYAASPL